VVEGWGESMEWDGNGYNYINKMGCFCLMDGIGLMTVLSYEWMDQRIDEWIRGSMDYMFIVYE